MRVGSWEYFGISPRKIVSLAALLSIVVWTLTEEATAGVLGGGSAELGILVGLIIFYLVLSAPKRLQEAQAFAQSREATAIAASSTAALSATRSKSRTVLQMSPDEPHLSALVSEIKRDVLLGHSVSSAYRKVESRIASYTARTVLKSVSDADPTTGEGGEEAQNISRASELSEESKIPLFMSVAFFSPIMLILFAVLTHQTSPGGLVELVGVQILLLDIGFYFSSSEKRLLS